MKEPLKVFLWDKEIGRLVWDSNTHNTYFTYHPDFLKTGCEIAPFTAPIKGARSRLPIYGEEDRKYQRLPSFLSDSLPDDWGNQLFEHWRIQNRLSTSDITPLEKLSFIGKRGMGALEFIPDSSKFFSNEKIDVPSLIDLAERLFQEREDAHIAPDESLTMQSLIAVGTSAGGRQPKAIIAIDKANGEIRSGQISEWKGYDHCILKFGNAQRSSAELEMTYYEMCCRAGINMMESRLFDVEGTKHFLTRRFDRTDEGKLHTQTLAAIYPGADSYEQLLAVCRKMRLSVKDCDEVFRRMVFNVLANNTDDHDKNFTFIMDQSGHWALAPAYDMTFIFNTGGYQPQEERCFMIRGKRSGIHQQDILDFAKDNGIRQAEAIINKVAQAVASFSAIAKKYQVEEKWITRIDACLSKNLAEWNYTVHENMEDKTCMTIDGHHITEARIEQAYKGNLHLLAQIDGREMKYIFRIGTEEYEHINECGIFKITKEELQQLIQQFLITKLDKPFNA